MVGASGHEPWPALYDCHGLVTACAANAAASYEPSMHFRLCLLVHHAFMHLLDPHMACLQCQNFQFGLTRVQQNGARDCP